MCRMVVIFGVALMVFVSCAAPAAPGGNLLSTPTAVASGKTIYVSAPNKPMILVETGQCWISTGLQSTRRRRVPSSEHGSVAGSDGCFGLGNSHRGGRRKDCSRSGTLEGAVAPLGQRQCPSKDSMADVSADRVVDETEMDRICYLQQQWEAQITAARDYVQEYRRIEPDVVEKNPGLQDLEDEAERSLEIVMEVKQICR